MTARISKASTVEGKTQDDSATDSWIEVLRGGDRVKIRAIHPDDSAMERRFIEELSPQSRRFRFLATISSPSEALLKQLTEIDPVTEAAYVAVIDDGAGDQEVGVARFSAQADGKNCEFAVTVSDKWQNKGLGTHLMHHLIQAARRRGIASMQSSDAEANDLMRRFATHLHIQHGPDPEDATQILYSIDLREADAELRVP
jgi:GNAT superfamily N-acetyltransferase